MIPTEQLIPFNLDSRNVKDAYKNISTDNIASIMTQHSSELIIGFMNVAGDFNKATGIRNAAFFNIDSIMIIGNRKWDKRGAVGAWNYIPISHIELSQVEEWFVSARSKGYVIYGAENNIPDIRTIPIYDVRFPVKTIVLFGEEGSGLPDYILDECDQLIEITGKGVMRSLNVGVASGIIIYEYSVQHGFI